MGYCDDCGNTLCICDIETKNSYQYRMKIKELEAQNEIMREALEFYSKTESWDADGWIANAGLHEPWGDQGISLGGKRAIEALKKVGEV